LSIYNKKEVLGFLIQKYNNNYLGNSMNSQSLFRFTAFVFTYLFLASHAYSSMLTPIASYAQEADESETSTEQEIGQKNVCSGWTICVNEGTSSEKAAISEEAQTLLATPS
jgi:hypothetical protein